MILVAQATNIEEKIDWISVQEAGSDPEHVSLFRTIQIAMLTTKAFEKYSFP